MAQPRDLWLDEVRDYPGQRAVTRLHLHMLALRTGSGVNGRFDYWNSRGISFRFSGAKRQIQ